MLLCLVICRCSAAPFKLIFTIELQIEQRYSGDAVQDSSHGRQASNAFGSCQASQNSGGSLQGKPAPAASFQMREKY